MRAIAREKSIAPNTYITGFGAYAAMNKRTSTPTGSPSSPNVRIAVSPTASSARASPDPATFKPGVPRSPYASSSNTSSFAPAFAPSSRVTSATGRSARSASASLSKITRSPVEPLDEDVDRAAARQTDGDRIGVADAVRHQSRTAGRNGVLCFLVDRRLHAAAADRAGHVTALVHGHHRARIARRRLLDRDDGRDGDALPLAAPAFDGLEDFDHGTLLRRRARRPHHTPV